MCGISVLAGNFGADELHRAAQQMNAKMVHRGPDAEGVQIVENRGPCVVFGHRRLSIIDLTRGQQPMCNHDGTIWITYNGEVYNHLQLRRELESLGYCYRTASDTETVLYAYEEWGQESVHRLQGMFSFAIWDTRQMQLFAARDRLGIKPFYYHECDAGLICASEMKAIPASGYYHPKLRMESLPEMLTFGYLAGSETLLQGVRKLQPGHALIWKNGRSSILQYWDVPLPSREDAPQSDEDWIHEFRERFQASVRDRLMSDVPLGVFLSGGMDSSAIAATMAKEMSSPLKTFSVGFGSGYYSELDYARQVAASLGAEHHEVVLTAEATFASLPRMIWHEDEPLRSAASTALHWVSRLASEHVKVVLTGEGSDELFAGYDRYWAILFNLKWGRLYEKFMPPNIRDRFIRQRLWSWPLPRSLKSKLSHTFLYHSLSPEQIIFDNFYAIFPARTHSQLFSVDVQRAIADCDPYETSVQLYRMRDSESPLDRLLYADQKAYLVDLLMKQDQMSMAASIESRVPFLDHEIVEFAARVPLHMKLAGRQGKQIVKEAFRPMLPSSILKRKKMGFPVPVARWLQEGFSDLIRNVLFSDESRNRGLFSQQFIHQLFAEHREGKRDHTDRLWALLNFELWARMFIDGQSPEAVTEVMRDSPCARYDSSAA